MKRYRVLHWVPAVIGGVSHIADEDHCHFDADTHGVVDGVLTLYRMYESDGTLKVRTTEVVAVFAAGTWSVLTVEEPEPAF